MKTINKVQTGDTVAGTTTTTISDGLYTIPSYSQSEKGWECPRCGRINAPWVRQCDCSRNNWTITRDDPTGGDEWWKQYVTCDSDTFKIHPDDTTWKTPSSTCSDSATVSKSNTHTYTTSTIEVGGSDYWNDTEKIWSNVLKNVSNVKEIY